MRFPFRYASRYFRGKESDDRGDVYERERAILNSTARAPGNASRAVTDTKIAEFQDISRAIPREVYVAIKSRGIMRLLPVASRARFLPLS